MRVLLFPYQILHALGGMYYQDFIYRQRSLGNSVHISRCNGELHRTCDLIWRMYPDEYAKGCDACKKCFNTFFKTLKFSDSNIINLKLRNPEQYTRKIFNDYNQLYSYKYNNFDIGAATASTIITLTNDYKINFNIYADNISDLISDGERLYDYFSEIMKKYDAIYVFNGRYSIQRAGLRAAQNLKIDCFTLEFMLGIDTYCICENTYIHDIEHFSTKMSQYFTEKIEDEAQTAQIAQNYFQKIRQGKNIFSFTQLQKKNLLPDGFNTQKRNIGIFLSTLSEFVAIDKWQSNLIPSNDQVAFLAALSTFFETQDKDLFFYVRCHPNNMGIHTSQGKELRALKELGLKNMKVILPHEEVDTYTLIEKCEKVISFGSTVGLEATYWGKASIVLSPSYYNSLDAVYVPKTFKEIVTLISQKDLPAKPRENTYPYAYFRKRFGILVQIPSWWTYPNNCFTRVFMILRMHYECLAESFRKYIGSFKIVKRIKAYIRTALSFLKKNESFIQHNPEVIHQNAISIDSEVVLKLQKEELFYNTTAPQERDDLAKRAQELVLLIHHAVQ